MTREKWILSGIVLVLIVAISISFMWIRASKAPAQAGESRAPTFNQATLVKPVPPRWEKMSEDPRDISAEVRFRENPPYEFRGGRGTGRVVDRAGNVLLRSGEEIAIFDVNVSPDKKLILVVGGDKGSLVLNPSTNAKIKLPALPPGKNMLGLDWHWIDAANLLGVGATHALDEAGKPVRGDDNVGETRLYVFNLRSQELAGLALPREAKTLVVDISEMGDGGYVHMVEGVSNGREGDDLGWFKIVPQGSFEK